MKNQNVKGHAKLAQHFWLIVFFAIGMGTNAQTGGKKIAGIVTSLDDGIPLPGVTVRVKGTNNGTSSDFDGNYSIEVEGAESILIFSSIGFKTQEITVGQRQVVNIELAPDTQALDGVVVTALGIKRQDKSLGYSVENVKGDELSRVAQENVLNGLSGKVAGVTLNQTGGTGSSVNMVIRGATSLSSDNQPLFVVDGVPIGSGLNNMTEFGSRNIVDYGNAISDLDPESIADVTILKGPSAAALYGSRAGNGVVLITTKKSDGKNKMRVNITTNTVMDLPYRFLETETRFASGYFSYTPEDVGSIILPEVDPAAEFIGGSQLDQGYYAIQWDAPLDANGNPIPTELISYKNNVRNFVRPAFTATNSISITNSNEWINYRLGYTNMQHEGLVPNSDLNRNNISMSANSTVAKNVTVETNINYNHTWADNRPSSNRGTNPLQWAYATPPNIDVRKLQDYWLPGMEGSAIKRISEDHENPYFLAHEVNNSLQRHRIFGNVVATWQITPDVSLRGRYGLNKYEETKETKIAPGYSRESNNGAYGIGTSSGLERNIDVLATYSQDWGGFDFRGSIGGNTMYQRGQSISAYSKAGNGLVVPNVFTLGNIGTDALGYGSSLSERSINSLYALANFGIQDIVYVDLTYRSDWSSTLPANNNRYDYPSASLSFLPSGLFKIPGVDLLKLRGGWAQVGNDTSPYRLLNTFGNSGQWGNATRLNVPGTLLSPNLKPETATSVEYGLDLKMFNDRLRFEGTYYTVNNKDQIINNIPIASSSGYNRINLNAAELEGKGLELSLGLTPIKSENWTWDLNLNYTTNETKIKKLAEGVDFIEFWDDARAVSFGYAENAAEGHDGLLGNIYTRPILRVKDESSPYYGYPILDVGLDAEWQKDEEYTKVGNYNPDFVMGLQSSLRYKNFTLNMTFDWRSGGQYVSQTHRYMNEAGLTKTITDRLVAPPSGSVPGPELREWVQQNADRLIFSDDLLSVGGYNRETGGMPESYSGMTLYDGAFIPGVMGHYDENGNFVVEQENLGDEGTTFLPFGVTNPWDIGTSSMFDADFIKLREISLGYSIPQKHIKKIGLSSLDLSVYSRNIMIWTKDSFGVDPERAFQAESGSGNRGTQYKQGVERYNVDPWVIPIGVKIGLSF
ncbi:SusC/RagA family TonB-linked outer membrane protein [Sinomicrobium oceani]|uniref:SusC/RagA family TonB-linked outer membrane protein n=1 Tax=Sinomicrobium oceani TaxID=1150368 RepID=UPI00227C5BE2|nr:SusC/RagA family TonB-linked outer membrane protein [Sinomicrobium oceani]